MVSEGCYSLLQNGVMIMLMGEKAYGPVFFVVAKLLTTGPSGRDAKNS